MSHKYFGDLKENGMGASFDTFSYCNNFQYVSELWSKPFSHVLMVLLVSGFDLGCILQQSLSEMVVILGAVYIFIFGCPT